MNLKRFGLTVASLAVAAVAANLPADPASALTLNKGDILQISDEDFQGVRVSPAALDFGINGPALGRFRVVGGDASTGGFDALEGKAGFIKDLSLPNPTASQRTEFLKIVNPGFSDLIFDLDPKSNIEATFTNLAGPFTQYGAGVFKGKFRNASGAIFGSGNLSVLLSDGVAAAIQSGGSATSGYLLSIEVTDIPTPALLPGLVGLGIAAIRKRKAKQETAAAEA